MKSESEIIRRLENYKDNISLIRNERGKQLINYCISELNWVLNKEVK